MSESSSITSKTLVERGREMACHVRLSIPQGQLVTELVEEIERLTRVHEQDSAEFRRLDERNDRLRAALLQIRDATVLPGGLTTLTRREMREIAETAVGNEPRARGGSSDETGERHG